MKSIFISLKKTQIIDRHYSYVYKIGLIIVLRKGEK